jgi:hypothetical protein
LLINHSIILYKWLQLPGSYYLSNSLYKYHPIHLRHHFILRRYILLLKTIRSYIIPLRNSWYLIIVKAMSNPVLASQRHSFKMSATSIDFAIAHQCYFFFTLKRIKFHLDSMVTLCPGRAKVSFIWVLIAT